jgi:hypothetical protein
VLDVRWASREAGHSFLPIWRDRPVQLDEATAVAAHRHSEGQSWCGMAGRKHPSCCSLRRFLRLILSHLVPGMAAASIIE